MTPFTPIKLSVIYKRDFIRLGIRLICSSYPEQESNPHSYDFRSHIQASQNANLNY